MRFAAANFATALGASTLKMRVDRARHCWAHALSTSAEAQRRHLGDALNLWAHPVCSKGKSLLGKYSALKTSGLLHSLSPSHRAREKSRDLYKALSSPSFTDMRGQFGPTMRTRCGLLRRTCM